METFFVLIESKAGILYSFMMLSVILILVGIQNVTRKDLKEYFEYKKHIHKIDRLIAWGIFYIIFGSLILVSSISYILG